MGLTISIFTYAGVFFDDKMNNSTPYLTISCSLIGVFTALYLALKDFISGK